MRCCHVSELPGKPDRQMSDEEEVEFCLGTLPAGETALVCTKCWGEFRVNAFLKKFFDWEDRVTVLSLRKPRPIDEQPLDKLFQEMA
jgi:hypothetical protein